MRVLCGTSAQYKFYAEPIRKAGFARDLSNTASFLRPFTMLAETSKQISA